MEAGSKKFVAIQNKSFDLVVEGRCDDVLRITENGRGRGRKFSAFLRDSVALLLLKAWGSFCTSKHKYGVTQLVEGKIFISCS